MTDRSTEQAAVQTRPPGHENAQDTTRIPLAERLQRRISAANSNGNGTSSQATRESSRVLPPMPQELRSDQQPTTQTEAPAPAPVQQPVPDARTPEKTAPVPVGRLRSALRRTPGDAQAGAPAPVPAAAPKPAPTAARGPRRARLRLSRIDPWSVMKVSFLLSIAFGIVTVVSVFMVWSVLGAAGVWSSINNTVSDTVSSGNNVSTFNIEDYLGMSRVLGFTMLVSVIDVILITAIATLGAFLYNMASSLLGGIEVTLTEDS
jgi:Transmembrane domain of unknown function (DUF3566)